MKNQFRDLRLQQLDDQLASWKAVPSGARPGVGWVRTLREAIGMSATALARRLGITPAGVRKLEISEAEDAISLATLRRIAEALDCELRYALVPRSSLTQHTQEQAERVAKERLRPVVYSMALEDQAVKGSVTKLQLEQEVKGLLEGPRRALW